MKTYVVICYLISLLIAGYLGYRFRWPFKKIKNTPFSTEYILGLNFLINNETDKAIEILIKLLESNKHTAQVHLAIGNLFRKHGEIESAIRIHQNLLLRSGLEKKYYDEALLGLAQDYLCAGLLDRAERFFLDLVEANTFLQPALKGLLDIYSQEKKWLQAIEMGTRLEKIDGQSMGGLLAHFHCELAEQYKKNNDIQTALTYLQDALILDSRCVRASLLQAEIYLSLAEYELTIESLKQVEEQDPDYLPLIIKSLAESYQKLGKPERLVQDLRKLLKKYPSLPVVFILLEPLCAWKGKDVAAHMLENYLMDFPSLRGLQSWIQLKISYLNASENQHPDYKKINVILEKILLNEANFKCQSCGFSGKVLYWHCPTCKDWGSMKPLF